MDELAVAMQDVFSPDPSVSHPQTTAVSMEERGGADKSDASSSTTTMRPFAKVNSVATNSPASKAGLLPSDRILRFADVAPSSSPSDDARLLGMVGEATRRNEGSEVTVVVMRGEEERQRMVVLTLRPTADWGGRGLLGSVLPPSSPSLSRPHSLSTDCLVRSPDATSCRCEPFALHPSSPSPDPQVHPSPSPPSPHYKSASSSPFFSNKTDRTDYQYSRHNRMPLLRGGACDFPCRQNRSVMASVREGRGGLNNARPALPSRL